MWIFTAGWWCCDCDSWWLLWLPTLLLLLLLCETEPGCGAGRLWWRAGAVGCISCVCRNHGSLPVVTVDGWEKPRWWPTTTDWCPDVCTFTAWLFITSSDPVELRLRKIFLRYFRQPIAFVCFASNDSASNRTKVGTNNNYWCDKTMAVEDNGTNEINKWNCLKVFFSLDLQSSNSFAVTTCDNGKTNISNLFANLWR